MRVIFDIVAGIVTGGTLAIAGYLLVHYLSLLFPIVI